MGKKKTVTDLLFTVTAALLVAVGMHVFVYPADFAPAGVDGIAAMLQTLTGVNAGVFTVLINLPLLVAAWLLLKRRYVLYTLLYTVLLSAFLLLLSRAEFYRFEPTGDRILSAIFGGVGQGMTGIMLRIGSSSGGVDIMGSILGRRLTGMPVERIISLISLLIVSASFFVYGNLESVLLSVVEIYVCERVTAAILHRQKAA